MNIRDSSKRNNEDIDFKKFDLTFYKSILENSLELPDSVNYPYYYSEFFESSYCYDPNFEEIFIPTYQLIEGYANLLEIIFWGSVNKNWRYKFNEKSVPKSWPDEYFSPTEYLIKFFHKAFFYDTVNFNYTCISIYEIAFMTPFHPALIFSDHKLSINNLLIPKRFNQLIQFFFKNQTTIKDYCDPKTNLIDGLDRICDELRWVKYSDCLKALDWEYSNFAISTKIGRYCNYLSKIIIRNKLKGSIIPTDHNLPIKEIPLLIIYNDGVAITPKESLDFELSQEQLWWGIIESILYNILLGEIVFGKPFKSSEVFLKRISGMPIVNKKELFQFLKDRSLDRFYKFN